MNRIRISGAITASRSASTLPLTSGMTTSVSSRSTPRAEQTRAASSGPPTASTS